MDGKDELKQPVSDAQAGATAEATSADLQPADASAATAEQPLDAAFEEEEDDE